MLVMVRSARTLRSMAALVSVVVERRARVHASGWAAGVGGRALYSSGVFVCCIRNILDMSLIFLRL